MTTNTDPRATNHEADELRQMLAEMDPKDAPAPPVLVDRLDRALSTERDLMVRQEDHLPCDRSDCSPLLCGHPVAR